MATINSEFRATYDEMGDWGGQEQDAANCWNKYVAPALHEQYEKLCSDESVEPEDVVGSTQSLAWEKFCDTTDDESWDELGKRVAAFVRQ